MKGFIKANVYIEGKGIINTNLGFENGIITYIGDDESVIDQPLPIANNLTVFPGFIDEHIHGAAGADAMDGTTEALHTISKALASEGTTGFLATTMTQSPKNIKNAVKAVKEYVSTSANDGAKLLGVHLEGPFISEKHVGAQPEEYLAAPDCKVFDEYFLESGNNVKLISLAPEKEGADKLISHLKELNVRVGAGHTDATFSDIERAAGLGLTSITHTYNAQKGVHHREVGTVGAGMLLDELYVEAICDLIHLSVPAIKLLLKNKPKDKFILITDSMRAKHLPDGISELGGQKVIVKNGEARLENGALAGSVLKMNDAIKNLVTRCGVSIDDAINFATINPAKHLGIENSVGSIKVGKSADFAILDENFKVNTTFVSGREVYKN